MADERDRQADERDRRADARESSSGRDAPGASADRTAARRDRQAAARDRRFSRQDRQASRADRSDATRQRESYLIDELTGVYSRQAGLMELTRELEIALRTHRPFTLAFVDLDHLKITNDTLGHGTGDRLLRVVAETIKTAIRSYDPVIRYGGDEFLCGMLDLTEAEAAKRFQAVSESLEATQHGSISVGLTQAQAKDSLEDLIRRADDDMYRTRRRRRTTLS